MRFDSVCSWLPPAFSLLFVGWGANQFASMLSLYESEYGISRLTVTSMLGVYIIGLLPALLLGGPLSDRLGRKRASIIALIIGMLASLVMIAVLWSTHLLYVGRILAGAATGLAMAATTSWVAELSQLGSRSKATTESGSKRASLFTSMGFLLGPMVSGSMAVVGPLPEILPYAVHITLCVPVVILLYGIPETNRRQPKVAIVGSDADNQWAYAGAGWRFATVVVPAAPWVFGSASIGFVVIPGLQTLSHDGMLLYSMAAVALTLGSGVAVQPLSQKLHSLRSARSSVVALSLTVVGLTMSIVTAIGHNPWLGLLASCLLGGGYGIVMASGLFETHRLSNPQRLGSATGKFYAFGYAGFLFPALISAFMLWFSAHAVLLGMLVVAVTSLVMLIVNSSKHLSESI